MNTELLFEMQQLYTAIDQSVRQREEINRSHLQCKAGCAACCVDEVTVFEVEAHYITHSAAEILRTATPAPAGTCAFQDESCCCRIYQWRPYVCRTQGLPLQWSEVTESGASVVWRDICPINESSTPLETLPDESFWTIGPIEEALALLQHRHGSRNSVRVPLRELFLR